MWLNWIDEHLKSVGWYQWLILKANRMHNVVNTIKDWGDLYEDRAVSKTLVLVTAIICMIMSKMLDLRTVLKYFWKRNQSSIVAKVPDKLSESSLSNRKKPKAGFWARTSLKYMTALRGGEKRLPGRGVDAGNLRRTGARRLTVDSRGEINKLCSRFEFCRLRPWNYQGLKECVWILICLNIFLSKTIDKVLTPSISVPMNILISRIFTASVYRISLRLYETFKCVLQQSLGSYLHDYESRKTIQFIIAKGSKKIHFILWILLII